MDRVSNASAMPLMIWIEPWCDELSLPPRSMLSMEHCGEDQDGLPDIESIEDRLVVWATVAGTLRISIDGIEQDTGSRTIALSAELLAMPVKAFVTSVFGNTPTARPAGAPSGLRPSLWRRLWRRAKTFVPSRIGLDRRR